MEKWSNADSKTPRLQHSNTPSGAFALYEVLMGLAIFALGVLALGRAVGNCLNATTLNAEENRVRQILSNRMAEVQAAPGYPDAMKEFNIDTGYGTVKLIQKSAPAELTENDGAQLHGVNLVTLTAKWKRGGMEQSQQIEFYVYRPG
jgi:Tfp pilus assembly protein PilV